MRKKIQYSLLLLLLLGLAACGNGGQGASDGDSGLESASGEELPSGTSADDGIIDPDTSTLPPDDPEEPPTNDASKTFVLSPDEQSHDFGQTALNTAQEAKYSLTNKSDAAVTVNAYLDNAPGFMLVDPYDPEVTTDYWQAPLEKDTSLDVVLRLTASKSGQFGGTLVIAIPSANQQFQIALSGEVLTDFLALTSPAATTYLSNEATVLVSGSVASPDVTDVTLTLTNEANTSLLSNEAGKVTVSAERFRSDLAIPTSTGSYTLTVTAKVGSQSYSVKRLIVREAAPVLAVSLTNKAGAAVSARLTAEEDLSISAELTNLSAAGQVTISATLNNKSMGRQTLAPSLVGGGKSVNFALSKNVIRQHRANDVVVTAENRLGSIESKLNFSVDWEAPTVAISSPERRFVDKINTVLDEGLLIKGRVNGMGAYLSALHAQHSILTDGTGNQCLPNTPTAVALTPPASEESAEETEETTAITVDPCPLVLYVNRSAPSAFPSGDSLRELIRVLPEADGTFSLVVQGDELAFGVNIVSFLARDELGHLGMQTIAFQIGDLQELSYENGELSLPKLLQPLGLLVSDDLLSEPELIDGINESFFTGAEANTMDEMLDELGETTLTLGDVLSDLTPGMKECVGALGTPQYVNYVGETGYKDRNDLPEACDEFKDAVKKIIEEHPDSCKDDEGNKVKPSYSIMIFGSDPLARQLPDWYFNGVKRENISKGMISLNSVEIIDDAGTVEIKAQVDDLYGNFLLLNWTKDTGNFPYVFPLRWNVKKIDITARLRIENGRLVMQGGDIHWDADNTKCEDGYYDYGTDNFAFGCSAKNPYLLWDISTKYGVTAFSTFGSMSTDEFYRKVKRERARRDMEDTAVYVLGIVKESLEDQFNAAIGVDVKPSCKKEDLNLLAALNGALSTDSFAMTWYKFPLSISSEGITLRGHPKVTLKNIAIPYKEAFTVPAITRRVNTPELSTVPGKPSADILIPEELINHALQFVWLKGVGSFLDPASPYAIALDNYTLTCEMGVDLAASGVSLSTGYVGDPLAKPARFEFVFPPRFAPTVRIDTAPARVNDETVGVNGKVNSMEIATEGRISLGLGNIGLNVYDLDEPKRPLASFQIDSLFHFSVRPVPNQASLTLELRQLAESEAESFVNLTVLDHRTQRTQAIEVRNSLKPLIDAALEGFTPLCLRIAIPDQIPLSEKVDISLCPDEGSSATAKASAARPTAEGSPPNGASTGHGPRDSATAEIRDTVCPVDISPDEQAEEESSNFLEALGLETIELNHAEIEIHPGYIQYRTAIDLIGE